MSIPAIRAELTQAFLKSLVSYDPLTGHFTRIMAIGNNTKSGDRAGWKTSTGYIAITVLNRRFMAHRLAFFYMTGQFPEYEVDHKNMDRSDNRWENLRPATANENGRNRPASKSNRLGLKGVSFHKLTSKYIAQATHQGKNFYLGVFETPDLAKAAYDNFCQQNHGEFLRS